MKDPEFNVSQNFYIKDSPSNESQEIIRRLGLDWGSRWVYYGKQNGIPKRWGFGQAPMEIPIVSDIQALDFLNSLAVSELSIRELIAQIKWKFFNDGFRCNVKIDLTKIV